MSVEIASLEKVRSAVAELHQQGKRATADAVIGLVGGGSKQTVLHHLKSIRSAVAPENETVPQAVIDAAKPVLSQIFAFGVQAEVARNKDSTERLHRLMSDLEGQVEELAAATLAQETEMRTLKKTLSAQTEALSHANNLLDERQREIDRLQQALADRTKSEATAVAELFAGLEGRVSELAAKLAPTAGSEAAKT